MTTQHITYKIIDNDTYVFYDDNGEVIAKIKNLFGISELIKLLTIKK